MFPRCLVVVVAVLTTACLNATGPGTGGGAGGNGGGSAAGGGTGTPTGPTWYKDVLPIVQTRCLGCHVNGGIAPFPLDSYASASAMAGAMANAVTARRMPPWLADETCSGPYRGSKALPAADITTINQWVEAGALEGNPADAPPPPMGTGDALPRVDATLQMPEAYTPSATLTDDYRCFIVDPAVAQTTVVSGYDILPGNKTVVHHVIVYVVSRTTAQAKDAEDTTPGWQCFGGANISSTATLGAWAPGGSAVVYPAGTGIRIQPGDVLAMQVHYNTANGRSADQTSMKLMYGTGTETNAYLLPLVASGFSIPANAQDYSYSRSFPNQFGIPIKLYGFLPHMHTKGKKISLRGGAANDCLVDIPRWDFHWQTQYFRPSPFILPANQSITMSCTWDNPTANRVTWGEGTDDEMCFAYVYATP